MNEINSVEFKVYDCSIEKEVNLNKIFEWIKDNKAIKVLAIINLQIFLSDDNKYLLMNSARESFAKLNNVLLFGMLNETELNFYHKAFDFHTFVSIIERFESIETQEVQANNTYEVNNTHLKSDKVEKEINKNLDLLKKFDEDKSLFEQHIDDYFITCYELVNQYKDIFEYDNSIKYFEKALILIELDLYKNVLKVSELYNNIAFVFYKNSQYEMALKYNQKSLEIREKVLGEEHPDTATTYNNIGGLYESLGQYEKALEYHEKTLGIREKLQGV